MITIEQAAKITNTISRNDISSEEITNVLKQMNITVQAEDYKSLNKFEDFDVWHAVGSYYRWVAYGIFKNRVIYSPCNTAILIERYNSVKGN